MPRLLTVGGRPQFRRDQVRRLGSPPGNMLPTRRLQRCDRPRSVSLRCLGDADCQCYEYMRGGFGAWKMGACKWRMAFLVPVLDFGYLITFDQSSVDGW